MVRSTSVPAALLPWTVELREIASRAWAHRRWVLLACVVTLLCEVHLAYPLGVTGETTYLALTVGATVFAWIGARRQPSDTVFPWTWVAVAVACSALADVIYFALGYGSTTLTQPTVADALWLASYVALAIGMSSLIVGGTRKRQADIDGLIDIGSFAVLAGILATQVTTVRDLITDDAYSISTRAVWTSYPVLDAALLGVVMQATFGRRLRGRSGLAVGIGVVLWLVSDFMSLLVAEVDTTLRWLDLGWMLGAIALASGAWLRDPLEPSPARGSRWADATRARPLITLLPLTVPATIELFAFAVGRTVNPVPLFVATVLLVVLAAVRSTRLVRARNLQTQELERSTHFYAALAQNSSDAVIVIDADGRMLNDAPNLAAMLGRPDLATKGVLAADLLRPADPARAHETLERWRATSGVVEEAELQATHADGSPRWFGVRATNLTADPVVGGVVVNLRDITDRRRTERQLNFNTLHDPITGLANRALFHDRLEHALQRTARTAANVAVIYLDLDDFKLLNDSEGHEAGDELLCEVAARLVSTVRTADTVARVGGDEFAILSIEDPHAEVTIEAIADRVLQTLSAPFILEGRSIVLSASIGIALGDGRGNASSMMRDVDVAMYRAKTTGKAKWVRYEPAMRAAALKKLALDNDLRHALARQQFHLVYQPVIDLRTNAIAGFEALLRWDHPTRGVISPDAFIPVAESNGTIVAIGRWVLDEACHTAAAWQRAHPAMALTMAVNLSARQIATPDIVGQVCDALERSGLPPHSLVLEITESVVIDDAETAGDRLRELRHLGVQLAIDDFGTGYSSLSYLRQFDVDILKIDKSFVDTITARSPVPPIVRSLLDLADTLHLQTVAEGIELDVQLDSLRAQACDYGQGFLLSKPLDAGAAAALLAENELVSARVSS